MTKKPPAQDVDKPRRKFLQGALAAGATTTVAVAVTGGLATEEAEAAAAPQAKKPRGYQESEHVSAYYRTARI